MMRFWFLIFALMCSFLAIGQDIETDSIPTKDTVAEKKVKKLPPVGIYAEGQMIYAPTPDTYDFSRQLGGGISYKKFSLGLFYSLFTGDYSRLLIFPNEFDVLYAHGGGYLGFLLWDSRYLEAGFRINFSKGDMVWEYSETREDFARDEFHVLKPEIMISFIPVKYVKLYAAAGYNGYYGLELPAITSEDFSGLTLGLGLQIGYFNK